MELRDPASTEPDNFARRVLRWQQDDTPEPEHRNQRSKPRAWRHPDPQTLCAMGRVCLPGFLRKCKLQRFSSKVREPELARIEHLDFLCVVEMYRLRKLARRNHATASVLKSGTVRL